MTEVEYTDAEIKKSWEDLFAREEYRLQLTELARVFPEKRSLYVDFRDIEDNDIHFSGLLLDEPDRCLNAGVQVIREFSDVFSDSELRVNLRIKKLPADSKVEIRNMRSSHLKKFVAVEGLVRKVTGVNSKCIRARFTCARCGQEIWVPQDRMYFTRPIACPNPVSNCNKGANSFIFDEDASKYIDSQLIEIEERHDSLRGGENPERKTGFMEDDICGTVTTGKRVILNGIVRSIEKKDNDKSTVFETRLEIISIDFEDHDYEATKITDEDELRIKQMSKDPQLFEHLVQSVSPTIHGLVEIKEAIVLQLFGGVRKINDDGSTTRGDIHVLFVGDPGIAKTMILRYTRTLAPRSVYASGKSASGAGLTAAVVKDSEFGDGRWTLEAGALVLADGGLACIDELDKMTEQDTSSLHEAMESQSISFAKAGITATLQCRCSILAAANPDKGKFNKDVPLGQQISMLPPALKSRFDLIFALTDDVDKNNDRSLADFILGVHQRGEVNMNGGVDAQIPGVDVEQVLEATKKYKPYYDPDVIKKYIAYAKQRIFPYMTDEVRDSIAQQFVTIRSKSADGMPITARQLEAYVRLAEASARMRLSPKVEKVDADRAIRLINYYLEKVASDGRGGFDMSMTNTGISSQERNTGNMAEMAILKFIREAGPAGADINDIIAAVHEIVEENVVRETLRKLVARGTLYNPKTDKYKVV